MRIIKWTTGRGRVKRVIIKNGGGVKDKGKYGAKGDWRLGGIRIKERKRITWVMGMGRRK